MGRRSIISAEGGGRRYSDAQQLFLGNLPQFATEDELRALFARFGPVAELRVHTKAGVGGQQRHANYGFITYETSQAAHDCLKAAVSVRPPAPAGLAGPPLTARSLSAAAVLPAGLAGRREAQRGGEEGARRAPPHVVAALLPAAPRLPPLAARPPRPPRLVAR